MSSLTSSSKALSRKLKDKIKTKFGRKGSVKMACNPKPSSPNLLGLPDELLIQIEPYLYSQNDPQNTCLVSRSPARMAQERLYQNIDFVPNGKLASGPATYSLRLLLRTLIERSGLISRVKSFNVYIRNCRQPWEDVHGTSNAFNVCEGHHPTEGIPSELHTQMLFRIVLRLKVPSQQPWVPDTRVPDILPGCDGALADVLLAMPPCPSKLRIETARSMPRLFKMLFGSKLDGGFPLARVAGFAKMKVCHISHCRADFPWFGPYKEVPLLGLPCLTMLHLASLHRLAALQRTRFINCVGISHVTDLRIGGVNVPNMEQFLGRFKPLQSFAYCGHDVLISNNTIVDFSNIVLLLHRSYASLECLEITLLKDRPNLTYQLIGSLRPFLRLERIHNTTTCFSSQHEPLHADAR
ncbi:uncharacterized protein K441DRAFT_53082 [Cenococcum geophilum 1.58]|uniref:uncharacterized protein n=1 Tax=Cenococcum geophilum 1.58 TaxID=794803 RepID=UPI0035901C22|nr:hypothetical protein K441DRAFT_53082 [Cenococcum geophilum 1.58]